MEASSLTLSGFSAGASQAANMMAFYNDNIDGVALLSGRGPCATFGVWDANTDTRNDQCWEPKNIRVGHQTHSYDTRGYKDKPVYISVGTGDT